MNVIPSYGPPRTARTKVIAIAAAVLLIIMLVAQLFAYEDFAGVLATILPYNNLTATTVTAAAIVLFELLAIPYLVGAYISKLMRILSAAVCFLISGFWLQSALTNAHASNSGLFSTALSLSGGILAAIWTILLFALVLYVLFADSKFRHDASS